MDTNFICGVCGKNKLQNYCAECFGEIDKTTQAKERLEQIRAEIQAERVSMGEINELQALSAYIDKDDTELLMWAGVCEACGKQEDEDGRCGCVNIDAF